MIPGQQIAFRHARCAVNSPQLNLPQATLPHLTSPKPTRSWWHRTDETLAARCTLFL